MRRVVESSDSRSGNRRANADFCVLDLFDLLDPLVAFLAGFFVDLLGFLDDLERADGLAMISISSYGSWEFSAHTQGGKQTLSSCYATVSLSRFRVQLLEPVLDDDQFVGSVCAQIPNHQEALIVR